jgi:uncharacterized protein (UPF0332 family)
MLLSVRRTREEAEGHRRLAMGLMATVRIADDASEWEIRNAISRGYYAVFHMCHAWLAFRDVAKPSEHLTLRRTVHIELGEVSGQRLAHFYALRKDADYNPWMLEAQEYSGSLDTFRERASKRLEQMKAEFERYWNRINEIVEKPDGGRTNGNSNAD